MLYIYIYRCAYAITHFHSQNLMRLPRYHLRQRPLYRQADEAPAGAFHGGWGARRFMKKLGGSPWLTDLAAAHLDPKNAGFDSYLFCICSAMFWNHWWLRCLDAWKLGGGAWLEILIWSTISGHIPNDHQLWVMGDDGYRQIEGLQPLG